MRGYYDVVDGWTFEIPSKYQVPQERRFDSNSFGFINEMVNIVQETLNQFDGFFGTTSIFTQNEIIFPPGLSDIKYYNNRYEESIIKTIDVISILESRKKIRKIFDITLNGQCNLLYIDKNGDVKKKWIGRTSSEYITEKGDIPYGILQFTVINSSENNPPYNLLSIKTFSDVWYNVTEIGKRNEKEIELTEVNRINLVNHLNKLKRIFTNAKIYSEDDPLNWENKDKIPFP